MLPLDHTRVGRATLLMLNGVVGDFTFAARLVLPASAASEAGRRTAVLSTLFNNDTIAGMFSILVD